MKPKSILLPIMSILMGIVTLLCIWNAIADFRAAATMRHIKAKTISANLTIDWGRTESDSYEEPLYKLVIDMVALDESHRAIHWEGDPGQAVYPEEAIDSLKRFAPGTEHTVSMLRGNAREVRFDQLESNQEKDKAFAWCFGAVFFGLIALGTYGAMQGKTGPWVVFFGFGLLPLSGSIPFGLSGYQKLTTWKQVIGHPVGERAPFDVTKPIPNVQLTPKAIENLPKHDYYRFEFDWNGQKLNAGHGIWHGPYDPVGSQLELKFFVNPKDRWEIDTELTWKEDLFIPVGVMLLFGVVFCAAGLVIRGSGKGFKADFKRRGWKT